MQKRSNAQELHCSTCRGTFREVGVKRSGNTVDMPVFFYIGKKAGFLVHKSGFWHTAKNVKTMQSAHTIEKGEVK